MGVKDKEWRYFASFFIKWNLYFLYKAFWHHYIFVRSLYKMIGYRQNFNNYCSNPEISENKIKFYQISWITSKSSETNDHTSKLRLLINYYAQTLSFLVHKKSFTKATLFTSNKGWGYVWLHIFNF